MKNKMEVKTEEIKAETIKKLETYCREYVEMMNEECDISLDYSVESLKVAEELLLELYYNEISIEEYEVIRDVRYQALSCYIILVYEKHNAPGSWEVEFLEDANGDYEISEISYKTDNAWFSPFDWVKKNIFYGVEDGIYTKYFALLDINKTLCN